ncbi:MAG: carbonic anhydrase [Solirubrobacterales bacterium]
MSHTDKMIDHAGSYAQRFDKGNLPAPPGKRVAVIACMDSRLNPYGLLGLSEGDAHVIRNAGGVVSEDVIRSLAISQSLLGTDAVVLIHHTDCGMLSFTDEEFADRLEAESGERPEWHALAFSDLDSDIREGIERIKASPFIPRTDNVRGFIYEVVTGELHEVLTKAPTQKRLS